MFKLQFDIVVSTFKFLAEDGVEDEIHNKPFDIEDGEDDDDEDDEEGVVFEQVADVLCKSLVYENRSFVNPCCWVFAAIGGKYGSWNGL